MIHVTAKGKIRCYKTSSIQSAAFTQICKNGSRWLLAHIIGITDT